MADKARKVGNKWVRQVVNTETNGQTSLCSEETKRETKGKRTKQGESWWNRIPALRKESGKRRQAEDKAQTRS